MKQIILLHLLIIIILTGCSNLFVSSLNQKMVASIKIGVAPGEIQIQTEETDGINEGDESDNGGNSKDGKNKDEKNKDIKKKPRWDDNALKTLTFKIAVHKNKIIAADNNFKRLQIFDDDGSLELIIGSINTKESKEKKSYKEVNFNFNVIGSFAMDNDNNIYVQNRLVTKSSTGDSDFLPSYIIVFNKNGELQYTMGKTGTQDIPFFYIEKLFIDSEERFFVLSRSFNSWELIRFNNKKREKYEDFSKLNFVETENNSTYKGAIENIEIFESGNGVIISVAYYNDVRFKYRKLYEYSLDKSEIVREITNIDDPKNVLFNIVDDKILYFWNIEGKETKFILFNMSGNIINNIKIDFDRNNIFSKIIHNESGTIYSYHVNDDRLKIYSWK
ncbi:MAG: hypothetical protein FWF73_02330 [Spirochaetes bacterium]|nr:hypothetical protein [Spirochaetota bacterium]